MPPRSPRLSGDALPGESTLVMRNVTVLRKRTSLRLEPEIWDGLTDIAEREGKTIHDICTRVAEVKPDAASLSAAIRVFVIHYYRVATTEEGHRLVGHGTGIDPVEMAFRSK